MNLKELALQVLNGKPTRKPSGNQREKSRKLSPSKKHKKFPTTLWHWVNENKETLKAMGFTEKDLFNESLPFGIAHLKRDKKNLVIKIIGQTLSISWD